MQNGNEIKDQFENWIANIGIDLAIDIVQIKPFFDRFADTYIMSKGQFDALLNAERQKGRDDTATLARNALVLPSNVDSVEIRFR